MMELMRGTELNNTAKVCRIPTYREERGWLGRGRVE